MRVRVVETTKTRNRMDILYIKNNNGKLFTGNCWATFERENVAVNGQSNKVKMVYLTVKKEL